MLLIEPRGAGSSGPGQRAHHRPRGAWSSLTPARSGSTATPSATTATSACSSSWLGDSRLARNSVSVRMNQNRPANRGLFKSGW